jgi:Protein of unknown function (DUF2959)
MQAAAVEVQAESNAVDLAVKALNELLTEPGADLRQPFRHYSAMVDRLETAARKTQSTGQRMAQRNAAYLTNREKTLDTIDYDHIRELSQTRRGEVGDRFEAIKRKYQESQEAVQPLITYLKDIRTALGTDLTAGGTESLKQIMENAERNAAKVQTALAALDDELRVSGARLSSLTQQQQAVRATEPSGGAQE